MPGGIVATDPLSFGRSGAGNPRGALRSEKWCGLPFDLLAGALRETRERPAEMKWRALQPHRWAGK